MHVTVFTDPGCPFGFNAQRQDFQLLWHYGHAVTIERRMIVLREQTMAYEDVGMTRAMIAAGNAHLIGLYGMPMASAAQDEARATIDACRAYVGARLHRPERAAALVRALRRRAHSDLQPLDDRSTIAGAAGDAGIADADVTAWLADDEVEAALRADMAAARAPLPEALALPHKLSGRDGSYRYSTASAVYEHDGRTIVAPGFQPFAVHEVAVASLAPGIERRPAPSSAAEALAWASTPLATAEVAELRGVSIDAARTELAAAGASFAPAGSDGYWSA